MPITDRTNQTTKQRFREGVYRHDNGWNGLQSTKSESVRGRFPGLPHRARSFTDFNRAFVDTASEEAPYAGLQKQRKITLRLPPLIRRHSTISSHQCRLICRNNADRWRALMRQKKMRGLGVRNKCLHSFLHDALPISLHIPSWPWTRCKHLFLTPSPLIFFGA